MATDETGLSAPIILAHRGEIDRSRIQELEQRLDQLEVTVEKLCQVSARERDAITQRIRELELAS